MLESSLDAADAKRRLTDYLAKNPDTDFILALGAAAAEAALDVIDTAGLGGKVTLGTFDMSPKVLKAVADGKMVWSIDAQPYLMGCVPVVTFNLMKQYKLLPIDKELYATGPSFVEKLDADAMMDLARQGIR